MYERHPHTVELAWQAAVWLTARAYKLDAKVLGSTAAGGRGPRTPTPYWRARKVAIYVTVEIADCTYAAVARAIGMHRDTVTSQVDEVRGLIEADRLLAQLVETLEQYGRRRLTGELLIALARGQDDLDHIQGLRRDRLPTRMPPAPPKIRGAGAPRRAKIRLILGGLNEVTKTLSAPGSGPAE